MSSPFSIGVIGMLHLSRTSETARPLSKLVRDALEANPACEKGIAISIALSSEVECLCAQTALSLGIPIDAVIAEGDEYASAVGADERDGILHRCQTIHRISQPREADDPRFITGRWILNRSDLTIFVWDGSPPGKTEQIGLLVQEARLAGRPFTVLDPLRGTAMTSGAVFGREARTPVVSPKREFGADKHTVYKSGSVEVTQYTVRMPNATTATRQIIELPESVMVIPVHEETLLLIEEYNFGAGIWQLKFPGGKAEFTQSNELEEQAQRELRQEIGYKAKRLEPLVRFSSHPGTISHRVQVFVAQGLEWDPLDLEPREEIKLRPSSFRLALAETLIDCRFDPEAASALWSYALSVGQVSIRGDG